MGDLAGHQARLEAHRARLLQEGTVALEPNRSDPGSSRRDDDAQPLNEMHQSIASHRNRERTVELAAVDHALAKLRDDPEDFGLCEACDEAIRSRRLHVIPWAKFCIGCQEKRDPERGRRRSLNDYV